MAANAQVIRLLQKQRAKLEQKVAQAEKSIADWKGQMDSLDGAIAALGGTGRRGSRGRTRGTWKPGGRGRPPKWYLEQKKAGGKRTPGAKESKPSKPAKKRKKRVSAKVLAGLARAREALAKKRAAAAGKAAS